jgi:hypothetical protein
MATKTAAKAKVTLDSIRPTESQWREYREGRNSRYWCAAMLSLLIFPSIENEAYLKADYPDVYDEYKSRLRILLKRRDSYPPIKPLGTTHVDSTPRNQKVSLHGVAKLASELEWDQSKEFAKLVSPPASVKTLDGSHTLKISDVEFDSETKDMSRREQNKTVRYAALVHLLRMAIDSPVEFNVLRKLLLGKRNEVSTQALGLAVEKAVATLAKCNGKERVPAGFGKDKNADEISVVEKFAKANL